MCGETLLSGIILLHIGHSTVGSDELFPGNSSSTSEDGPLVAARRFPFASVVIEVDVWDESVRDIGPRLEDSEGCIDETSTLELDGDLRRFLFRGVLGLLGGGGFWAFEINSRIYDLDSFHAEMASSIT